MKTAFDYVRNAIVEVLYPDQLGNSEAIEITPETRLAEDLGMDSLDLVDLTLWIDADLDVADVISDHETEGLFTVADVMAVVRKRAPELI